MSSKRLAIQVTPGSLLKAEIRSRRGGENIPTGISSLSLREKIHQTEDMSLPVTLESYRVEALDLRGTQSVIRDSYEGRATSQ